MNRLRVIHSVDASVGVTSTPDLADIGMAACLAGLPELRSNVLARLIRAHGVAGLWERIVSEGCVTIPAAQPSAIDSPITVPPERIAAWRAALLAKDFVAVGTQHQRADVQVIPVDTPLFPPALAALRDPPGVIFVRGRTDLLLGAGPRVAMVGTRHASPYGRSMATQLATALAEMGISVVSGLAAGIDGVSHRAVCRALAQGGAPPVGVVGCGLDRPYPSSNAGVWEDVARDGVLVSEWPLGSSPVAWHFPARNRLIAALSAAVVVVESDVRGGSMDTARHTLELGRPLLAVPGPVSSRSSAGCNALLQDGAAPCVDGDDVFVAIGLLSKAAAKRRRRAAADAAYVSSPDHRPPNERRPPTEQSSPAEQRSPRDARSSTPTPSAPSQLSAPLGNNYSPQRLAFPAAEVRPIPSERGAAVLRAIGWEVCSTEATLARVAGFTPGALLLTLHELEFDGWVARGSDGWFQLAGAEGR